MTRCPVLVLAGCLAAAHSLASLVVVATPAGLGSNDFTNWSQLGGNDAAIAQSFAATSSLGLAISGSLTGGGGLVEKVCPSAPACGWVTSGTGMSAGDSLIFTNNG